MAQLEFIHLLPLSYDTNFILLKEGNTTIDLTAFIDQLELRQPNQIQNNGILIEASQPLTAYYQVLGVDCPPWLTGCEVFNSDIFSLKGRNALGLEFYTPFQNKYDNQESVNAYSSIDIVASEDSTFIEIILSEDAVGFAKGDTIKTLLNRGQTHSVRALSTLASKHLTGTHVIASKPIAITLKDDSILANGWDLAGDQLIPITKIGTEYITSIGEHTLVATEDSTRIFLNGSFLVQLNAGEFFHEDNTSIGQAISYITSNKPIYVYHIIIIRENDVVTGGEASSAILPPIVCTGSEEVVFTRPTSENFWLSILTRKGAEDAFSVNGNTSIISPDDFQTADASTNKWVIAFIPLTSSVPVNQRTIVSNSKARFHLGILNGAGLTAAQYGYFSNFGSSVNLGLDATHCEGEEIVLDAGLEKDRYLWSTGDTTQQITVSIDGTYSVETIEGNGLCDAADTITLSFAPSPSFDLPNDISICEQSQLELQPFPRNTALNYEWSTGALTPSILVDEAGMYTVIGNNEFNCADTASIVISVIPQPTINVFSDTILCIGDSIPIQFDDQFQYTWTLPDETITNESSFTINKGGTYTIEVSNVCGSVSQELLVQQFIIETSNIITPNGDGMNDQLTFPGIETGGNWDLTIYNRWGNLIYSNEQYLNSWQAKDTADGVYFYELREINSERCNTFNGWVTVIR